MSSFFSDLDPESSPQSENSFFSDLPKTDDSIKGHVQRKAGGSAIEFGTRALTSIPNFIDSIQGMTARGANALLKKIGAKGLDDKEIEKVISLSKSLGPTAGIPEAGELIEKIHKQTGGKFKPQTGGEEILQKGAGIVGGIAGFGPVAALGTPLKAAGTLALGGTTAALEEAGVNPWLALGGGVLADVLTRSGGKGIGKAAGLLRGKGTELAGEAAAKIANVKPEQIKQGVIEAAERLGINPEELPMSAQIDNPFIQGIESRVRASSLSGKSLQKQLEGTGEKLKGTFDDIGSQLSQRQELLPSAISQEAINSLKRIEEKGEETYRKYYAESSKAVPQGAKIPDRFQNPINRVIDSTLKKLKSDLGTPAKDTLFARLSRLKKSWEGITPSVEQVIEAKKDLNQVIKYEVKGGVDKMLEPLAGVLRQSLQSYGKTNPSFLFRFNEAERLFEENSKTFRKNPMIRSLAKGEAPEQIINKMGTVKGIRDLGKVLNRTPEGKESFDALKKYRLENLIGSKLLNKEGKISWGNASGMLKNPKIRDQVIELVGPKNYGNLKDIVKVAQGVEEGLRKFLNTSGTATAHFDMALLVQVPLKAMSQLFSGRPIAAVKTMSWLIAPRILSNLMSNPKFIDSVKKAAHASKMNKMDLFLSEMKRAAQEVAGLVASEEPNPNDNAEES